MIFKTPGFQDHITDIILFGHIKMRYTYSLNDHMASTALKWDVFNDGSPKTPSGSSLMRWTSKKITPILHFFVDKN
jgi:hypothetical protein